MRVLLPLLAMLCVPAWAQVVPKAAPPAALAIAYPVARTGGVVDRFHGVAVADPYRWMEDLRGAELDAWIVAQNQLSAQMAADPRYAGVLARLKALSDLYPNKEPAREAGGRQFFRALVDGDLQLLVQEPGAPTPRVLVDASRMTPGTALKDFVPSPDGRQVAYVVGPDGTDWGEIRIHDLARGGDLPDVLADVRFTGPLDWTADGMGLLYRRFAAPRDGRRELPAETPALYLHRIGTPVATDVRIFELPADRADWTLAFGLHGERMQLFAYVERGPWGDGNVGGASAQVYLLELDRSGRLRAGASPRLLADAGASHRVVHATDSHAWVFTDRGAPRRRVVRIDLAHPEQSRWRDVIPETDAVLTRAAWYGGRLVVHGIENVHSVVRTYDVDGKALGDLMLPGTGVVQSLDGSATSPRISLLYSGLLQPPLVLEHDLERGTTTSSPGGRGAPDLSAFEVRQEWFTSRDGTRIPMFVMARRGLPRDGRHPLLLYAYGASGTMTLPAFAEDAAAWVQLGGVYAIANVRGGGEFGTAWYRAAIREHKQVSFDDLIAASEHLIASGWTSPGKLAISGASNGGLLVTATMLQKPGLFGAVLADVPVTDALRRHLSGNGKQQIEQWGTPDDAAVFPALRAYSPVHNVVAGSCYPATLVSTSRDDDRLPPWHAYKFTAALQAAQGCAHPVLLQVRDSGGHGGGDLDGWLQATAQRFVFLAQQLQVPLLEQ